jgi:hypothetical protein
MIECLVVVAELFVDSSNSVPCIVVSRVRRYAVSIRLESFVVFLICDVLMPLKRESIRELGIELRGTLEAAQGLFVIACKGPGIANGAPRLRRLPPARRLKKLMRSEREVVLKSSGRCLTYSFVIDLSVCI